MHGKRSGQCLAHSRALGARDSSTAGLVRQSAGRGSSPCFATHELSDLERLANAPVSFFTFRVRGYVEKAMAAHSSALAWRIPGRGSLAGCRLWGRTESDTTEAT